MLKNINLNYVLMPFLAPPEILHPPKNPNGAQSPLGIPLGIGGTLKAPMHTYIEIPQATIFPIPQWAPLFPIGGWGDPYGPQCTA